MTPQKALDSARAGALRPIYLVLGEERFLVARVVAALREAATAGGIAGFNDEKFVAGETPATSIVAAARMLPMMAKRRFVLVRGLERWETKARGEGDDDEGDDEAPEPVKGKPARALAPLDVLADYAKDPVPTTVLVLVATKLNGSRKLVTLAKKEDFLVSCELLARGALPGAAIAMAKERGHTMPMDVAEHLAEIAGPELSTISDAVERLSLFVGPGNAITEDAVAEVVTRVRQSSVWQLVGALAARRIDQALAILADVYDVRDRGLRLLGAITWSVRQLVKLDSALAAGLSPAEAGARAGVSPFKVNELAQTLGRMPKGTAARWLVLLAEVDLALKSSRRPADAILETLIVDMCRG